SQSWEGNTSAGTAASAEFVLRVLAIAADPPPDPEESRRVYQKRLELRQQRVEESLKNLSSRDAPVTFTRASYLKATSETRRNLSHTLAEQDTLEKNRLLSESLIPSSLFCHAYVASEECSPHFEATLQETCCARLELHRFVEHFATYVNNIALPVDHARAVRCNMVAPINQPELLYNYTQGLLSRATNPERQDAFSYSIQFVIDFIVSPGAAAGGVTTQLQRPQQSLFTSIRGFFQGSRGIELLKPFVCLELYGRKLNRDRFRVAHNKLSLHDHELLVDVLTTQDGSGGVSLMAVDHPCRPFVTGLRVCLRVAQVLHEKQQQGTGSSGHALLLDLLDSQCNVVDHVLSHVIGAASSSTTTSSDASSVDSRSVTSVLRDTAAVLASAVGPSTKDLCESLALSIGQQRLMLAAIAVIQWVADSPQPLGAAEMEQSSDSSSRNGKEDESNATSAAAPSDSSEAPSSVVQLDELLKQFSTVASSVSQFVNNKFLVLLSEALVELVVSMSAQVHLIPHLEAGQQQKSSSASTVIGGGPQKSRAGGSAASVASTSLSPSRDRSDASPGRFSVQPPPVRIISSAERKKSLQAFCAIVTQLTRHLHALLSPDVQSLLHDVVFRASHAENSQCPERALIDAATSSCSGANSSKSRSFSTFAQSPFRFLLEASLNQSTAAKDMEDVLYHLFVITEPNSSLETSPVTTPLHPTLLFTFVSARLRALREGRLSLASLLQHLDVLYDVVEQHDAAIELAASAGSRSPVAKKTTVKFLPQAISGVPRLRLEELWFHAPSTVEHLLEVDSAFVRNYQQSVLRNDAAIVTAVDIRAVSKRFEDVMSSLGVHAPTTQVTNGFRDVQRDQISFRRYLSAVDNIRCPVAAVQNYLRQLDRLARVASSASATADDLTPLLGSLVSAIGTEGGSPSFVWNPVFRRASSVDPTPMNSPIQLVEMITRVKQLSDLVHHIAGVQPALPDLIRHGHNMLFEAVHLGHMTSGRIEELLLDKRPVASTDDAFLRNVLVRILLTEHCVALQQEPMNASPSYLPSSQLRVASALAVLLSPTAATLFVFLYCTEDTVTSALQEARDGGDWFTNNHAPIWIRRWLAQHHTTMNVLDSVMDPSDVAVERHPSNVIKRSVQRAHFYFSPEAQFQSIAEVFILHCSADSRSDVALRELCEALPMELLLASLHHISDPEKALTVHSTVLDALLQQMTTLRAHQVLKFSGDASSSSTNSTSAASGGNSASKAVDIPETWCHIVEEVLFSCVPAPTIAAAFVGNLQPQHQESVLARHPVRTLLPLRAQKRVLQRVHRQVAVELHCDPEDSEHREISLAVSERLEQLSIFTSMQDSVGQLISNSTNASTGAPSQGLPACIRLLLIDPIPVELVVNQATVTDEALRRTLQETKGISPKEGLIIRVKHLSLVRSNTTSEDAQVLAIRSLCERYCELLLLALDPNATTSVDIAEFTFIKDLSALIRSEIATSPRTAPALIQRLVDKLLATSTLSTALLFRVVRFVTESSMTKYIFDGNEKWVRVSTGLHALNALVSFDCSTSDTAPAKGGAARRPSSSALASSTSSSALHSPNTQSRREDPDDVADDVDHQSGTFEASEKATRLQSLFGRPFLSQPLLVVENLLMMQRVSAAAAVLQTFRDPKLRKECDKLLLRYARMAVDMSRFLSMSGKRFPYGKELTDEPRRTAPPLSISAPLAIILDAEDDDGTLSNKRKAFEYTNTPHIPLFRRLIELVSDQRLMVECVGDFATALFDSLYDSSENHVVRALTIDTAENILWTLAQCSGNAGEHNSPDRVKSISSSGGGPHCPTEELRRLWHYLQISRHLVVCKWEAHPSREDLESEEGVMELITNLLHHGHNNGAFSIAEACNLDLRVVHGLWASRTTHLLNLGLFEEAANTLSTLPKERVQSILSTVLETVECTPIAVGFRALYASGSYKVKQFQPPATAAENPVAIAAATAAEVQSLMTQRRIGVRSLLGRFGAPGDVMAYCVRSFDFAQVFPIVVQLKKDDESFIKDVFQPVSDMDAVDTFRKAMLAYDPTLERMRLLLLAICKFQEGRQEYASLLSWQEFMCDYARGGQTAVLLATLPGDEKSVSYAQRIAYLAKAEKFFIEGKFQPASKQAPPQHSDSGVLLPVTRVDAQQLSQSLIQCRLQKDVWSLLHQHAPSTTDLVRFSLYGQVEQLAKVMVELVLLGKHFFEMIVKVISHLQLDIQHVYAPACLQLVRNKKSDVVEQLCEYMKKSMLLGIGERNAVMHEAFVGCFHEYEASNKANKKAFKLCEFILDCMTTECGWKAKVLIKLKRWPEALNESLASKDKQVILELYEKVAAVTPQDEETAHVANAARAYLARNNFRM
ncbi:Hypothetical protein, putative, partial [Bodo saltans]